MASARVSSALGKEILCALFLVLLKILKQSYYRFVTTAICFCSCFLSVICFRWYNCKTSHNFNSLDSCLEPSLGKIGSVSEIKIHRTDEKMLMTETIRMMHRMILHTSISILSIPMFDRWRKQNCQHARWRTKRFFKKVINTVDKWSEEKHKKFKGVRRTL